MMNELERIKETILTYVNGVVEFDFSKAENSWHPEGLKISYEKENQNLSKRTILETRPNLDNDEIELMKKRVSQKGTIISVDVTGIAASVKLVWNYRNAEEAREITDYILLLKIDDDWKIVAKVFNQ